MSSRSTGPLKCIVNVNNRVLIYWTCHFQSESLFFVYLAYSVCKSHPCLISTLTQGGKDGHLFRLTCSVVLWGGRDTANRYHWHVWGVLAVYGPHWVCPNSKWCVLLGSTLLRLQGALQGLCPKWALSFVHFPGLNCSGSHKGTDLVGLWVLCFSQVQEAQMTGCLASTLSQVGHVSVPGQAAWFPSALWEHHLKYAVYLLWGADLRLQPFWWMSTIQDLRKTWLAIGNLLTFWWRMRLHQHLAFSLWLSQACLQCRGGAYTQPASSLLVFIQSFVLWAGQASIIFNINLFILIGG